MQLSVNYSAEAEQLLREGKIGFDRFKCPDWPRPWTVAFEYGGIGKPFKWRSERRVIEEQVPRLYETMKM